jgi:hypothetical protein
MSTKLSEYQPRTREHTGNNKKNTMQEMAEEENRNGYVVFKYLARS